MGRPKKYFSEEERKQANRPTKTKYMLNKEWLCPVCGKGEAILRACEPEPRGRLFCEPASPSLEPRAASREPLFASPERFPPKNQKMGIMP